MVGGPTTAEEVAAAVGVVRDGTPTGKARRKLQTSKRLPEQPRTDDAIRRGRVSPDQADEISDGAAAKARADQDREARRRRLHHQRCVRRWNDADGMANLLLKLPGDAVAEVDAALRPRIDRAFADDHPPPSERDGPAPGPA